MLYDLYEMKERKSSSDQLCFVVISGLSLREGDVQEESYPLYDQCILSIVNMIFSCSLQITGQFKQSTILVSGLSENYHGQGQLLFTTQIPTKIKKESISMHRN